MSEKMADLKCSLLVILCLVSIALGLNPKELTCSTEEEMSRPWSSVDVNKYWVCTGPNSKVELNCDEGKGFLETNDVLGCVPWEEFPCQPTMPDCFGASEGKLHRHTNPNKFWACEAPGRPIEMDCFAGRGFMDSRSYLGCVLWSLWTTDGWCDTTVNFIVG